MTKIGSMNSGLKLQEVKEDFCHPRCQVLTRSSFASDMISGHSRMGIDSGECLNVIFEVTPSNISMSLMRPLIRCTHEVMTALIVLLPLIISLQLHRSIYKVQEETLKRSGLQLVVEGVVKAGGLVVEKVRQGLFCIVLISAFFM
ncbi:unnamed protein product [Sphagnum troendelagicum]|uniref:Uncharacterized protein n=1 Tax=Sphagnum troendelagicum TaxID=128251 RepID=A0ABP0TDV4_9BRYO